ncbi:MAG: DAK2 domain-containing protein [Acidimicrobiales bacterium]
MPVVEHLGAPVLVSVVVGFRDTVRRHAAGLNRLNVYPVPDGDTGTNMARTLDAVVAEIERAEIEQAEIERAEIERADGERAEPAGELGVVCRAISHGSLMGARGNSGVILSQVLRALASTIERAGALSASSVADGLGAASSAAYKAVLKPMEGTILTVVREAAGAAGRAAGAGADLVGTLDAAHRAGREALARTPELLPVLKEAGVVDAGGAGFLLLLDAALHVVDGRPLPEPTEVEGPDPLVLDALAHRGEGDVSELRFEVMYFLDLDDERIEDFKQGWGAIGDSIVVVGGDGQWNCHVHTNDIGAAVEVALDCGGRPRGIRVTDLFEEVAEEHQRREASMAGLPAVTTAVVAVASGPGISELFGALGVQGVVGGGQSANPSTAELLAAVEAVNATQVIVLPNNKNIIPVAEQLPGLTTRRVEVVPTRSMPEALAALVVYDPEAAAGANREAMAAAASSVATGEVTQAVRDSGERVRAGDWMGLVRGDGIVAVGATARAAAVALLEHLVGDEAELVTVLTGAEMDPDDLAAVTGWLAAERPDVAVEVHAGGQPLYPFLFGVE